MKKFSTLKDVAKEAGVAPMTVSRVVNDSGYVNEKTREEVLKAIEKLNYRPSVSARKLKALKSNIISIIIPDIKNDFYANIIESSEDVIRKNGMDIMIFNSKFSSELEKKFLELSVSDRVDGIILASTGGTEKEINNILVKNGIPIVILESYFKNVNTDYILHKYFEGTYLLTEHLIKTHSHKKIGYITLNVDLINEVTVEGLKGYKQALTDNKIEFDENLVMHGKPTVENGYNLTKSLILKEKTLQALICANTIFGTGAVKAFRDLKVRFPDDIAFVTFDEYDINSIITPSLTTLERVDRIFGENAANLLIKRIKEKKAAEKRVIEIPARLLIRESCGCLLQK